MSTPIDGDGDRATFSLEYVATCALSCLDYARAVKRPFTKSERKQYRWILEAFESHGVEAECENLPPTRTAAIRDLIARVGVVVDPLGLVKEGVLRRRAETMRMPVGMIATGLDGASGAAGRPSQCLRLSKGEVAERLDLFHDLVGGLGHLSGELAEVGATLPEGTVGRVKRVARAMGLVVARRRRRVSRVETSSVVRPVSVSGGVGGERGERFAEMTLY